MNKPFSEEAIERFASRLAFKIAWGVYGPAIIGFTVLAVGFLTMAILMTLGAL